MIKNIILDVDGTLWNTTEIVAKAWNKAIESDSTSEVRVDAKRLQGLFGRPMNIIGEMLFTDVDETDRIRLLDACCEYEQKALHEGEYHLLYDGVAETMRTLHEKGISLYIVSNCQSGYIELFLEKNGLQDVVKDTECYGNTGKSKGSNISLLMERNGLSGEETFYVGDTMGDYEAAIEAGISFVFAEYGFGEVPEARERIQKFDELLKKV
ncbi:MAG: HAD family hydrolase [Lachnospiraceae bacterium]|nr:HAD family hydrolase [Lachnospiraceae bacterium]